MYISRDSVLRGTHIWAKKECNLGHSSKAYTDDGPPRRHRRDLSCTVPNSFWSIHSMPCHAMSCCVAKLPPRLVKMREQEGFSLPGEIDDSQAAQAFVPPMG